MAHVVLPIRRCSSWASPAEHAFVYDTSMHDLGTLAPPRNGAMIDLNTLVDMGPFAGWELVDALDVNNNGWIIGGMQLGQNVEFGFILAPVSGVPELPSWAMMLTGFAAVTFVLRRRRGGGPATADPAVSVL